MNSLAFLFSPFFLKLADKMPIDHYKLEQAALRKRLNIEERNNITEANKNRTYGPWKFLCAEVLEQVYRYSRKEEQGLLLLVCRSWHETLPRPKQYTVRNARVQRDLVVRCPDIENLTLAIRPSDVDWDRLVGLNLKSLSVRGPGLGMHNSRPTPTDLSFIQPLIAKKELQWLMLYSGGFRNTSALAGFLPHLSTLYLHHAQISEADLVQLFEVLPSGCRVRVQPSPSELEAALHKRAMCTAGFPADRVEILNLRHSLCWLV